MHESPAPPNEPEAVPPTTAPVPPSVPAIFGWLPWLAALVLAVAAGWLAQLYLGARAEMISLREQAELSDIAASSLRQELQAERIVAARRLADAATGNLTVKGNPGIDYFAMVAPAARPSPATAVMVWDRSQRAGLLVAHNLPALPPGEEYQLWIAWNSPSAPACLGTFDAAPPARNVRLSVQAAKSLPTSGPKRFLLRIGHRGAPPAPDGPVVLQVP